MPITHAVSSHADQQNLPRRVFPAILRGLRNRCPACGKGHIYAGYLKIIPTCESCTEDLSHHQADDAPPYFAIFILGHILIPAIIAVEVGFEPVWWVHALIWAPAILLGTYFLLPRVKAAIVALQWALFMHGFGDTTDDGPDAH